MVSHGGMFPANDGVPPYCIVLEHPERAAHWMLGPGAATETTVPQPTQAGELTGKETRLGAASRAAGYLQTYAVEPGWARVGRTRMRADEASAAGVESQAGQEVYGSSARSFLYRSSHNDGERQPSAGVLVDGSC